MSPPSPVIIAKLVMPGFSRDLSTWVCSIDADGTVRQEVRLPRSDKPQSFVTRWEPGEVAAIQDAAIAGGFGQLERWYGAVEYTDLETVALAVRVGDRMHRVEAYGPGALAHAGSQEMQLFLELWDRITRGLPYPGK